MTGKPDWHLIKALSKLAGMPNLVDPIRTKAGEAALEPDTEGAIIALTEAAIAAEADMAAVKPHVQILNNRHKAAKEAYDLIREALAQYAQETGKKALDTPRIEVVLSPGKPTAKVTDIDKLPARFVEIEKKVKKRELNEAIVKDGEVIDGAVESNGEPFVTFKVKRRVTA